MTITDATCYTYTLPLRPPLTLAGSTVSQRRGALLRLTGEDGATGWGEAAPLPGFSPESREEAVEALALRARTLRGRSRPEEPGQLLQWGEPGDPSSVRFAVQSALLDLSAAQADGSIGTVLGEGREPVALNALVPADANGLEAQGERLRRAGFEAVKFKVGRGTPATDADRVQMLHTGLGNEVALRLDANRAWTFEEAKTFAEAVAPVPIEYVEEPLARPDRLDDFVAHTDLPVALDETTREGPPDALAERDHIAAVVLKPTLLGGLSATRRWRVWAGKGEVRTVISSSYESGVGTRMLVSLASAWSDAPVGLLAHSRLAEDVLHPRMQLAGPTVSRTVGWESEVDLSRLSPVDPS